MPPLRFTSLPNLPREESSQHSCNADRHTDSDGNDVWYRQRSAWGSAWTSAGIGLMYRRRWTSSATRPTRSRGFAAQMPGSGNRAGDRVGAGEHCDRISDSARGCRAVLLLEEWGDANFALFQIIIWLGTAI